MSLTNLGLNAIRNSDGVACYAWPPDRPLTGREAVVQAVATGLALIGVDWIVVGILDGSYSFETNASFAAGYTSGAEMPGRPPTLSAVATPTRVLGTAFQPNVDRLTFGVYVVQLDTPLTLVGASGTVTLRIGASNPPPSTTKDRSGNGLTGLSVTLGGTSSNTQSVCGFFKPGEFGQLVTANVSGTPTFTLVSSTEYTF